MYLCCLFSVTFKYDKGFGHIGHIQSNWVIVQSAEQDVCLL